MDAKILCLAALSQGDASGYEIRKIVKSGLLGHSRDIGYSSIYPALSCLLNDGLASVTKYSQIGRPGKKVYRLTPDGRMSLLGALKKPTEVDKTRSDFLFRMLFADILPPSVVEQMIDTKLREIEATLARIDTSADAGFESPGEAFVGGYAAAIQRAMANYIADNRHQLVGSFPGPSNKVRS